MPSIGQDIDPESSNLEILLVIYPRHNRAMFHVIFVYHSDVLFPEYPFFIICSGVASVANSRSVDRLFISLFIIIANSTTDNLQFIVIFFE